MKLLCCGSNFFDRGLSWGFLRFVIDVLEYARAKSITSGVGERILFNEEARRAPACAMLLLQSGFLGLKNIMPPHLILWDVVVSAFSLCVASMLGKRADELA